MHKKDKTEKILEDYNDVFADIYNVLVFGKKYLKAKYLEAGPTESVYKAAEGGLKEQRRDILKRYHGQNFIICSLGIENQSTIDKYMPIRIMGYDFAAYQEMVKNKKEIVPTISIVLNFSDTRWNQATSLHGMMQLPEELKELVSDYHFRVYDVAFLEDDVIDRFTSDFKVVAMFFKKKRLGELDSLGAVEYEIKHVEEVIEVFSVFSQDQRYMENAEDIIRYQKEGGKAVNTYILHSASFPFTPDFLTISSSSLILFYFI